MEFLQGVMLQFVHVTTGRMAYFRGQRNPHAPRGWAGVWAFLPAQDYMPPHQPPGPFPFSGVLLLLISLPHTFRHEQGRSVSP